MNGVQFTFDDGIVKMHYDPANPPVLFFDTNVIRGMNSKDEEVLQRLKSKIGYRFKMSLTNFMELA